MAMKESRKRTLQVKVEKRLQRSRRVEKVPSIAMSDQMCTLFLNYTVAPFFLPDIFLRHVAAQTISALLAAAGVGDTAKVKAITSLKEADINASECNHLLSLHLMYG
jgi:hypothetical protein